MKRPSLVDLLALTHFLSEHRLSTPAEIAETFGWTVPFTIAGVRELLAAEPRDAGHYGLTMWIHEDDDDDDLADVHIDADSLIESSTSDPPLTRLTPAETIVVVHLVDQVLALTPADSQPGEDLRELRAKIVEAGRQAGMASMIPSERPPEASPGVLRAIDEAMAANRRLEFNYHRGSGTHEAVSHRVVVPHSVVWESRTYLLAGDGTRSVRKYRLDRMSDARVSDQPFDRTELKRAQWALDDANEITGERVTLRISRHASWFRDFIGDCEVTPVPEAPDLLDVSFVCANHEFLRLCAIRLGHHLHGIEPPDVAAQVIAECQELAAHQRTLRPARESS